MPGAVTRVTPFVHVADVERSIAFYQRLGLRLGETVRRNDALIWAEMGPAPMQMMFAKASGPVDPAQQAVLFYCSADDLAALRERLLEAGLRDHGPYRGGHIANDGSGVVCSITHPGHMPAGEMRVEDPDGYTLLVGQLS